MIDLFLKIKTLISLVIVELQKNEVYILSNFQMLRKTQNRRHTE